MRILGERLSQTMAQPFIVENRPGAGGLIGMKVAAGSAPDGYTLVMGGSGPTGVSPVLDPKTPYDPVKDFEPVTGVASVPQMFLVSPSSPYKTLAEFIAAAKAKPNDIFYGSSGIGTTQHLFVEHFAAIAGIKLNHTPYKGSAPALNDLIGGHIPLISDTLSVALAQIKAGKARPLAVTSAQRSPFAPDVPTVAEQGVPGYEAIGWITVLAPRGTPSAILDQLSAEIAKIVQEPATAKRLDELGLTPMLIAREDLRSFIKTDMAKWKKVIEASNIKPE